jgi:hypothetical protein
MTATRTLIAAALFLTALSLQGCIAIQAAGAVAGAAVDVTGHVIGATGRAVTGH